jgi:hypothetical protein
MPCGVIMQGAPPTTRVDLEPTTAMKKIHFLDKYPVYVEELAKTETDCATTDDLVGRLCDQIRAKPGASLIGVFDHLAHVRSQPNGKVSPEIRDSRHVIFCLAKAIPYPLIASVGPRMISVVELADRFVVSYLEAPMEAPNQLMAGLVEALRGGSHAPVAFSPRGRASLAIASRQSSGG